MKRKKRNGGEGEEEEEEKVEVEEEEEFFIALHSLICFLAELSAPELSLVWCHIAHTALHCIKAPDSSIRTFDPAGRWSHLKTSPPAACPGVETSSPKANNLPNASRLSK